MPLAKDLLHPSPLEEKRKHKLKRLVQHPNSYFMDVKCPGCYKITTVFSHAQSEVVCAGCFTILCQPTGGKARLTEDSLSENYKRQRDEIFVLQTIYRKEELHFKSICRPICGCLKISVLLPFDSFKVIFNFGAHNKFHSYSTIVRHLPPIELYFIFSEDYPSVSKPNYILRCTWLSDDKLSKICDRLDLLWDTNEILYKWALFLKDDVFKCIESENELNIYFGGKTEETPMESGAVKNESNSWLKSDIAINTADCNNIQQFDNFTPYIRHVKQKGYMKSKNGDHVPISLPANVSKKVSKRSKNKHLETECFKYETEKEEIDRKNRDGCANELVTNSASSQNESETIVQTENVGTVADDNILSLLGPYNSIYESLPRVMSKVECDRKFYSETIAENDLIIFLEKYNESEMEREFLKGRHFCSICLEKHAGSLCFKFKPCGHIFCKSCICGYVTVGIGEGSVHTLGCPDPECSSDLVEEFAKEVLSETLFKKYKKLLFENSLHLNKKVLYCPRKVCQNIASFFDIDGDVIGHCKQCYFYFCLHCKKAYHGVEFCVSNKDERKQIVAEYQTADKVKRQELEKRYSKRQLQKWLDDDLSEQWIKTNSRPCPNCEAVIEKNDGCNKVICTRCRFPFCWLCNVVLNQTTPYEHFSDPSSICYQKLFPDEDDNFEFLPEAFGLPEGEDFQFDEFLNINDNL